MPSRARQSALEGSCGGNEALMIFQGPEGYITPGIAANTGNWLRCIGRSQSARNLIAPSPQRQRQKERNMTTYPVEFHRRLEQKWATRIDQVLVAANATPPRAPDDDDDEEDEEDEERDDDERDE